MSKTESTRQKLVSENAQLKKYWFRRKLYGWGWVPVTWQGWSVIGVYFIFILFLTSSFVKQKNSPIFIVTILATMGLLLAVCYYKGEKPRWQWGTVK